MEINIKNRLLVLVTAIIWLSSFTLTALGQDNSKNYVANFEVLESGVLLPSQIEQLSGNQLRTTIAYYSGLGKPVQSIIPGKSPLGNDIVTFTDYDNFGRVVESYLPFTEQNNNGGYVDDALSKQTTFYASPPPTYIGVPQTSVAYGAREYDDSPLNKVIKSSLPGEGYELESGNSKMYRFETNNSTEVINFEESLPGTISKVGFYAENMLHKVTVTDENGNPTTEFTDKKGRTILKRSISGGIDFDTYYIYNSHGQLACVIMPEADKSGSTFEDYDNAFTYTYDSRKRQVEKHIPGQGTTYYVYDSLDRLVAEQDEVMRKYYKPWWKFYKYDALDRVVIEGKHYTNDSRIHLQSKYNSYGSGQLNEEPSQDEAYFYYTNNVFPTEDIVLQVANYYDDYDFNNDGTSDHITYWQEGFSDDAYLNMKGMLTGTRHTSDAVQFITMEVFLYDSYYRLVQRSKILENNKKEMFFTGNYYSFGGAVLRTKYRYMSQTVQSLDYAIINHYDYNWRQTGYSLDLNGTVTEMVSNEYSEVETLVKKHLHSTGGNTIYTLDYRYNPRGWLTSINQFDHENFDNMLFALKLYYENPPQETMLPVFNQHNGNISLMKWYTRNAQNSPAINSYIFKYDSLNRIKEANFYEESQQGNFTVSIIDTIYDRYNAGFPDAIGSVGNIAYDKNGNIKTLTRAFLRDGISTVFDRLTYHYSGNRLIAVDDKIDGQNSMMDYTDNGHKYSSKPEFRYDPGGNMTEDINRGINVDYIAGLNLPHTISSLEGYIENGYFYNGVKYSKNQFNENGNLVTEETYFDNLVLRGGKPYRLLHNDGYINLTKEGQIDDIYFYIKDHLGNVRAVIRDDNTGSPKVIQAKTYYPFGMVFTSEMMQGTLADKTNSYLFNGKEQQEMPGLWYDYGARFFDPSLGRFMVQDKYAEAYYPLSPYSYCAGNPIKNVDVNGEFIGTIIGTVVGAAAGAYDAYQSGGDAWAGAAEGAVSGAIAGAAVDLVVAATVATGGGALVVIGAGAAAGAVGGAAGAVAGDATGQVVESVNKGSSVSDAVSNISTENMVDKATTGAITGAIGGAAGGAVGKGLQVAKNSTKAVQSTMSKNITETATTLTEMGADSKTVGTAVNKITTGMGEAGKNTVNSVNKVAAGTGMATESTIKTVQQVKKDEY